MSFEAVLWATSDAPIANVNEFAVLVMLAEKADSDGCAAFPARSTVAKRTTVDPKTVQRTLNGLAARKLIGPGDPKAAEYIRADRRPPVWDLMIPYDWFPNIDRINKERAERGKPALTRQNRPPIVPPPAKKTRSDKGKRRPQEQVAEHEGTPNVRGDSESPREMPLSQPNGGTDNPARGDCQSQTGGLEDPRTIPYEPDLDPVLPSAAEASGGKNGGTDGTRLPQQIKRNPGVDLLMSIGAEKPEFILTGKTLQDQGMAVAGMLLSGWTTEQLRQVIAGRKLPDQITTTVGAVVAGRLRQACAAPPPGNVSREAAETARRAPAGPPDGIPRSNCGECGARIRLIGQALNDGLCLPCREEMASV